MAASKSKSASKDDQLVTADDNSPSAPSQKRSPEYSRFVQGSKMTMVSGCGGGEGCEDGDAETQNLMLALRYHKDGVRFNMCLAPC